MAAFGNKIERGSWLATILSTILGTIIGVLGLLLTWYIWKHPADSPASPPVASAVQPGIDPQLSAQSMRTVAISMRSIASNHVANKLDPNWLAAESDFTKGNDSYANSQYAVAAAYFDKAQRAFNDLYSASEAASNNRTTADRIAALNAYIRKLDSQIKEKNEERIRSAPLEPGASNDSVSNSIEQQLATLRATRADVERQLIQVMAQQ